MAENLNALFSQIRCSVARLENGAFTDTELLERFIQDRDAASFEVMVWRHGPMILGVCQRLLHNMHDAEDVFQATFLALAQKAESISRRSSLASWLHTVATRTAGQVLTQRRKRADSPISWDELPVSTTQEHSHEEIEQVLQEELATLPEKYRVPLILSYLQGLSNAEVAESLSCPIGTIFTRLSRGRGLLKARMERRGLTLSATSFGVLLTQSSLATPLSHSLVDAGMAVINPTGKIPLKIIGLTQGTLKMMWQQKIQKLIICCLVACMLGAGSIVILSRILASTSLPLVEKDSKKNVDQLGDPLPAGAVLRLGTRRHRYLSQWPKQLFDQGKQLLLGTENEIRWVNVKSGKVTDTFRLPSGYVICGFSKDGQQALLWKDRLLSLWDLKGRKKARTFAGKYPWHSNLSHAVFDSRAHTIAMVAGEYAPRRYNRVWLLDALKGRTIWNTEKTTPRHTWRVLGFSSTEKEVLLIRPDLHISVRDRNTGTEIRSSARVPSPYGASCVLSPDRKSILYIGEGTIVHVWDVESGKERPAFRGHKDIVIHIAFSFDGKTIVTGGRDPFVLIRDWPTGKIRKRITIHGKGDSLGGLNLSATGKVLGVITWGHQAIRHFDIESGRELPQPTPGHRSPVYDVAITSDEKVISCGPEKIVRIWDLNTGKQLQAHRAMFPLGPANLSVSRDEKTIHCAEMNSGLLKSFERKTGQLVNTINTNTLSITSFSISPDEKYLATVHYGRTPGRSGYYLILRHFPEGDKLDHWQEVRDIRGKPVFSPDGKWLAIYSGPDILIWDLATRTVRFKLPHKNDAAALAFSRNSRLLASSAEKQLVVWELATGKKRWHTTVEKAWPEEIQFSPQGNLIARQQQNTIEIWDAYHGVKLQTFIGHDHQIRAVSFSPNGKRLVSGSDDTTMLVWDMTTIKPDSPTNPVKANRVNLVQAWKDLKNTDSEKALKAIQLLLSSPKLSLSIIREQLKPEPIANKELVARLLNDLDNTRFTIRDKASKKLQSFGASIAGPLKQLLKTSSSAEAKRRAQAILNQIQLPTSERLRNGRALEILEQMGKLAIPYLKELSKAEGLAEMTQEANASLHRLKQLMRE